MPELKEQKIKFFVDNKDNKEIDINKTIEENQIKKNTTIVIIPEEQLYKENNSNQGNVNDVKISVIMEDENQNSDSFICKINDKFSSLELELLKKYPLLNGKKLNYLIDNKKIDISKTLQQNNITDGSTIYYKIEKSIGGDEEISVIIKSSNQSIKSAFICKKSEKFKELEQKIYERFPVLKNKEHFYLCNGNRIDIEKTIEENKIKNSDQLLYNEIEENEDIEENEEINVIIKSTDQNIEISFNCKKSDKFKVLEDKLYEKYPNLNNEKHFYLCNGNRIDTEKTIEENKIKNKDQLLYNIDLYDDEEV